MKLVVFPKGVQRKYIRKIKFNHFANWNDFSNYLQLHRQTVLNYHSERTKCSPDTLKKLAKLLKPPKYNVIKTDEFIDPARFPRNKKLAEIVGIVLGDGGIYQHKLTKKYQTVVCFHHEEHDYLLKVKRLMEGYFSLRFYATKIANETLLRNASKTVAMKLQESGLQVGNKVSNNVVIPAWVFEKEEFLIATVRGIFDTDGSVYVKYGNFLQIQFNFSSKLLTNSVRKVLIKLGFSPTNLSQTKKGPHDSWRVWLCKQDEIHLFFSKIKPKNKKHWKRYGATGI